MNRSSLGETILVKVRKLFFRGWAHGNPQELHSSPFKDTGFVAELDAAVKVPGLSNIWVPLIRNRIDMLATGIKSPVGVKISGPDLGEIVRVAQAIERAVKDVPGVTSALAERLEGGRYLDITIDRAAAARYGLNVTEIQDVIAASIGGENIGETVEGLARFPISVRYPRELRDSVEALRMLPIVTERGAQVPLSAIARVRIVDGPPMLKSENARLSGWVYVDVRGRVLVSVAVPRCGWQLGESGVLVCRRAQHGAL